MGLSSDRIVVKGRSTEVLTAGQGDPLVFLHGGGIVEGFEAFEPLADRFRLIAPLTPGYGATELDPPLNGRDEIADHVTDVLDELAIERTALVGFSIGGWMAATVAARHPERVSELVLGAPFGIPDPEHQGADMSSMTPMEIMATLTGDASIWDGRLPSGPDPEFEAARIREQQSLMRFMPGPNDAELPSVLSEIGAPTLLLWGDDDKVHPIGQAAKWQEAIPQASLRTFPGVGHLLFHERPETLDAIIEFVESCRASA